MSATTGYYLAGDQLAASTPPPDQAPGARRRAAGGLPAPQCRARADGRGLPARRGVGRPARTPHRFAAHPGGAPRVDPAHQRPVLPGRDRRPLARRAVRRSRARAWRSGSSRPGGCSSCSWPRSCSCSRPSPTTCSRRSSRAGSAIDWRSWSCPRSSSSRGCRPGRRAILDAQQARGLVVGGSPARRVRALVPLVVPVVLGSLVDVRERTLALEARGFGARPGRTAYRVVADPPQDRWVRWASWRSRVAIVVVAIVGVRGDERGPRRRLVTACPLPGPRRPVLDDISLDRRPPASASASPAEPAPASRRWRSSPAGFIPRVVRATDRGARDRSMASTATATTGRCACSGGSGSCSRRRPTSCPARSRPCARSSPSGSRTWAVPRVEMDARIDAVLARLGIGHLAGREPFTLVRRGAAAGGDREHRRHGTAAPRPR